MIDWRAEIYRFPLTKAPAPNGFESTAGRVGSTVGILAHLSKPGPNSSVPDPQSFRDLPQAGALSLEPNDFFLILSDHFKSGQRLSLQNRPTGLAVRD